MLRILCALRGGPDSEKTIEHAVSLAKEKRARLILLYIVSLELFSSKSMRSESIAKELSRMGEFVLLMAQSKAAQAGVAADTFVRHGNIPEQLLATCEEMNASILILGKTDEENESSFFTPETQADFVKKVEETGVQVILKG